MIYLGADKYQFFLDFREIELTKYEIELIIEKYGVYEEMEKLQEKIEELEYTEDEIDIEIIKKRKILKELKHNIKLSKQQSILPRKPKRPYNKKSNIIKLVNDLKNENENYTNIGIFERVAKKLNISIKAVEKAYYNKKV